MRTWTQLGRLVVALSIMVSACDRGSGLVDEQEGKALANKVDVPRDSDDCDCAEKAKHDPPDMEIYQIAIGNSPSRGDANAKVTIVAFTDSECPFCAKAEERIRTLEKEYGSKIRIVYKNLPLPFHEHAMLAAKAMLAAHRQGKFFEYKDVVFAHQDAQERANLLEYAQELGLDMSRFERDLDDRAIEEAVQADIAEARRVTAVGTPTFFINGRKVVGAQPIEAFRKQVDEAIAH